MTVVPFIVENWDLLLVVFLILLGLYSLGLKWFDGVKEMDAAQITTELGRLLIHMVPMAMLFVTDAEEIYGPGTGPIKRAYVIEKLYHSIPLKYRAYVDEESLEKVISIALEQARGVWKNMTGESVYKDPDKNLGMNV